MAELNRPLETAELEFGEIFQAISNTSHLFKDESRKVAKVLRAVYPAVCSIRAKTEPDDAGDRELLHTYGDYLEKIAAALKTL